MAVLIVAYRSPGKLEKCIHALREHLPDHEVHIWDNSGAGYGEVRERAGRVPDVHWHFSDDNLGFAAAVNKLAALVPDHDLLLLNPDAELIGPLTLTRSAIQDPGTAAAGPMVWESGIDEGVPLLSRRRAPWDVAHRRLTFLNALGGAAGLGDRLRGSWFSNLYRRQPREVEGYLTGACLAIRRDAWDSLGPFDEEFFLYGEESDWQSRASRAGWKLRLADEIGVRHLPHGTVAGDSAGMTRSGDLFRASMALLLEYRYGVWVAELYLAGTSVIEVMRRRIRQRHTKVAQPDVVVTVDGPSSAVGERLSTALALAHAGQAVTVVSLRRLGSLPRELPPSIRLIRRPWWWPSVSPQDLPPALVVGTTSKEKRFARLYRAHRKTTRIDTGDGVGSHAGVNGRQGDRSSSPEVGHT